MSNKEFGNFDQIKKQMEEQKKRAEEAKNNSPNTQTPRTEDKAHTGEIQAFTINIIPPIERVEKKTVNYYLSKNLIKRIKKCAKKFNKKDSVLIEELLDQVLSNMGL